MIRTAPSVHLKGHNGVVPIQDGVARPGQVVPRYYFGSTAGCTTVLIPSGYPKSLEGHLMQVDQRLRLSDPEVGDELEFTFGWSADGRFWVLFGLDTSDPEDIRKMNEFPRMLRACAEGDTSVTGENPFHRSQAEVAYLEMRRAYALTEKAIK